jgi:hypothetical protein
LNLRAAASSTTPLLGGPGERRLDACRSVAGIFHFPSAGLPTPSLALMAAID